MAAAVAEVARHVDTFLTDQLQLAGQDGVVDLRVMDERGVLIEGKAGRRMRTTSTLLRASNILAGGTGAVLAVVATTQIWNPVGWTAAAVLGALSVASALTGWLGGKARKRAERQRVRARAKAISDARRSVSAQFDLWETEQLAAFSKGAWSSVEARLSDLLRRGVADRTGIQEIEALAESLSAQATAVPHAPPPEAVISKALALMVAGSTEANATESDVLLGEFWIRAEAASVAPVHLTKKERSAFRRHADTDRARLEELLAQMARSPRPAQARGWLDLVEHAGVVTEPMPDRPPMVLVGDFSASKTSLVKRLLAEAGQTVPESLVVKGGPETSVTSTYELGRFTLVDTPGFQSGREHHEAAAVEAARGAAVLVVVLNINLLIGDTALLTELLRGSARIAGKGARCILVIGRIDGFGVDPETAPRDFLNRRRRKEAELVAALASQGIQIRSDQVYSVAADPFKLVGNRTDVTSASYSDQNRAWDGIRSFLEPVLAVGEQAAERLRQQSAIDMAIAAIRTSREQSRAEIEGATADLTAAESVDASISTAQAELDQLRGSIDARAQMLIDEHADDLIGEALGAGPAEVHALAENLASWWKDPRLETALAGFERAVRDEIDEWFDNNRSQIDRRIDRMQFDASSRGFSTSEQAPGATDDTGNPAAKVLHESSRVVSALGNRDAVYGIGKFFNWKFRPWEATRGGMQVARGGAALGVVATAFDIYSWVRDSQQENSREAARREAVDYIRSTAPEIVDHILSGGESRTGPLPYLEDQSEVLETMRAQLAEGTRASEEVLERSTANVARCEALLQGISQIDPSYVEESE